MKMETPEQALETAMILFITADDDTPQEKIRELELMIGFLSEIVSKDAIEKIKAKIEKITQTS